MSTLVSSDGVRMLNVRSQIMPENERLAVQFDLNASQAIAV
jgi:hypothetical protein